VSFTSAVAGGGRVRNPFIAVWVEDTAGALVATISVWFEQGKGTKWLPDLRRWYDSSDGGADLTMSGATRVAGEYAVSWDGTDLAGNPVAAGDYVVFVESAREHGDYNLTSATITIGDGAFSTTMPAQSELSALTVELRV
jgi:hypothetical protein